MPIRNFDDLLAAAHRNGPKGVVAVCAQQDSILKAVAAAQEIGIIHGVLIGDEPEIHAVAATCGVDISDMQIIHQPEIQIAARRAMGLIAEGKAQIAMKGKIDTATFLRAALDREMGLRTGTLLSHVAVFDMQDLGRLLLVSDAGVNIAPTLEQKADIVRNAIGVAHRLGISEPKVAVLASTETVNPRIPANVEAAALAKMADRGQITGALVDGPLALDNAISPDAEEDKEIRSPVECRADILISPDIEAGNMLVKAIVYFARHPMAGVVVGAKVPLILPSRSDTFESKLDSIALGVVMALA
ncbi:MAG: bifunctional enoyl-CoA hydratase/phosphate acetyltransferase [Anaerolineae bacterium]